jgi:hypothetical protein
MPSTAIAKATLSYQLHKLANTGIAKLEGARAPRSFWVELAGGDKQRLGRQLVLLSSCKRPHKVGNAAPSQLLRFCSDQLVKGALARLGTCFSEVLCIVDALHKLNEVQDSQDLRELVIATCQAQPCKLCWHALLQFSPLWANLIVDSGVADAAIHNKIRIHERKMKQCSSNNSSNRGVCAQVGQPG